MSMIEMHDLRVRKGGKVICSVAELRLEPGDRVSVLGPNGSGKSTLMRVLARLEREIEGRCSFGDLAMRDTTLVHQQPFLFRGSVLANVTYGLRARGRRGKQAESEARTWLERLGAAELASRRVNGLSGGERRRVALARALVLSPSLLLLDEPLADLDNEGRARVAAILHDLPADTTLVVAEPQQSPEFESLRGCQQRHIG